MEKERTIGIVGLGLIGVWSADGKSIYFLSSRATKDQAYNIWKMNFNL